MMGRRSSKKEFTGLPPQVDGEPAPGFGDGQIMKNLRMPEASISRLSNSKIVAKILPRFWCRGASKAGEVV
jgi:hypothetical protein